MGGAVYSSNFAKVDYRSPPSELRRLSIQLTAGVSAGTAGAQLATLPRKLESQIFHHNDESIKTPFNTCQKSGEWGSRSALFAPRDEAPLFPESAKSEVTKREMAPRFDQKWKKELALNPRRSMLCIVILWYKQRQSKRLAAPTNEKRGA